MPKRQHCQVCGKDVAVGKNGIPSGTHKRTKVTASNASGQTVVTETCPGSSRETTEHRERRWTYSESRDG